MKNANYRKNNDQSLNSSTYHKKDGTNIRAILKRETKKDINEECKMPYIKISDCSECKDCRIQKDYTEDSWECNRCKIFIEG